MAITMSSAIRYSAIFASIMICTRAVGQGDPQIPGDSVGVVHVNQDPRARAFGVSDVKVVDGEPVPAGVLLATVGVTYGSGRRPYCTGTLIAPDIVLTAAHCVCGDLDNPDDRVSGVFVGTDWAQADGPSAGHHYRVVDFRSGIAWPRRATPSQCSIGLREGRDIAVLELETPVVGVSPMSFAPENVVERSRGYRVAGFGAIDQDAQVFRNEKHEASVTAASNNCRGRVNSRSDEVHYGCLPGEEIVAGNRNAPDSCRGDSGGPLLVTASGDAGADVREAFLLAGVTSRAINDSPRLCGYGGVYERLTPIAIQWVNQGIQALRRN